MISFETLHFISMLNELAIESKDGFIPFSEAKSNSEGIFYDDKNEQHQIEAECGHSYLVIADYCMDEWGTHHDIISYYGEHEEYDMYVIIPNDEEPYIKIMLYGNEILVHDGKWYVA